RHYWWSNSIRMIQPLALLSFLLAIVYAVPDEEFQESLLALSFAETLPSEKRDEFRRIFLDKDLNESERGLKMKGLMSTLDQEQVDAYEGLKSALRKIKGNGDQELPHLSTENQLLLKKYDALAAEKKQLSIDADHASLMKMLGEERLLRASQIVFIESLPPETRIKFSRIQFDESLSKDEQLERCAKIAATLPNKSKRFFEHIRRQQIKFHEDREARIAKMNPKAKQAMKKIEQLDAQMKQTFNESKNKDEFANYITKRAIRRLFGALANAPSAD
uniref:Uncharacterized protein n=1 Tax=Parascaris univalens TaxID=6257 RepID=A0A915BHF7_PARUN